MQRFFDKVKINENGCHNWVAAKRGKSGYGAFKFNGKVIDAHRVSWIIHNGEIPTNMCICHKCNNRVCVNPAHLFIGTHSDNMADCFKKGRGVISNGKKFNIGHTPINSSLTKDYVNKIKNALKNRTGTIKNLSIELSVKYQTLRDINIGRIYK